jgi:biotin carboxylase
MSNTLIVSPAGTRNLNGFTDGHPLRVWLNQTYATNYWIVDMIRNNPDGVPVSVYTTSDRDTSPVLQAGDHSSLEPDRDALVGDDYVDWALEYCRKNFIDVFIPMRGMIPISARVHEFEAAGTKVLVSPADSVALLDDKNLAYLSAKENGIAVPPWYIASSAGEMEEAYYKLRDELEVDERVVIKPVQGVGAAGFRIIKNDKQTLDDILEKPKNVISIKELIEVLSDTEAKGQEVPAFMVLPFLDEPETSVDCLSDVDGRVIAAVPRSKKSSFRTLAQDAQSTIDLAVMVSETYGLRYLTNTQIRWFRGEPVLLETNTRISGGMYASALAGINLPWEGIKLALTGAVEEPFNLKLGDVFVNLSSVVPFTKKIGN